MLSPTCAGYIAPVQPRSRLHHISLLQARLVTGHAAGGRRVICSSTPGESYSHCITRSDLGNQRGSRHRGLNRQLQVDTSHRCCYADQKSSSATAEDDSLAEADEDGKARAKLRKQAPSSWTAKHAGADADTQSDFLSNLGEGQDYNINVDHGKSCHPVTNSIIMRAVIVRCWIRMPSCAHSNTGKSQSDILACAGQNISQIDSLFVGDILGKKSDIADGSLRDWDFRKFNNLVGDYWIAPTFLDNMGVRSDHA